MTAETLIGLGKKERALHNLAAARSYYQEAAEIYRSADDPLKFAHTIRHVADIYLADSQPELAEPLYREALDLYRRNERTAPLDLANAIRGLAVLKSDAGDAGARVLWTEARELYGSVGVEAGVQEANRRLALAQT